jgi:putative DNA primase/helicase
MAEITKPFAEVVAEKLIEQMKAGTAPWQKPWREGEAGTVLPFNPTTGNRYRGINAIYLMSQGHSDQRWMTYKQTASAGANVRKGEKGTAIQYWKFSDEKSKTDSDGKPVLDADGKPVKESVELERPRCFFATVFNAEQIEGLPALAPRTDQTWNGLERAEKILHASGAVIHSGEQNRAFYRPATDTIHLPDKGQFPTADNYYATALHELGHWTGHSTRLGRDLAHPFGSEGYAREELRAEIASMILGDELGIGHDPAQHAAYVGSWIKVLQDDPLEIFRAASDAEKIQGYVLGLELKMVQEQSAQQEPFDQNAGDPGLAAAASVEVPSIFITRQSPNTEAVMPKQNAEETGAELEQRAEINEHEKAAKLARINEARLLSDPNSTQEEISAARASRKDAEFAAARNDADLISRIERFERDRQMAALNRSAPQSAIAPISEKALIAVPYKQKDEAKALGAKWDRQEQSWYVPRGVDVAPFARWMQGAVKTDLGATPAPRLPVHGKDERKPERIYLAVPYAERKAANAAGAEWDKSAKSWYAGPKADMARLEQWVPENIPAQQGPAMTPREEFAAALKAIGCVLSGEHPVMNGEPHRITVAGKKFSESSGSGFYVGHLDGHPAGYIKNNKTGIDTIWKSKGYALNADQEAQLRSQASAKLKAREAEQAAGHERAALRVARQMNDLIPVSQSTPYMLDKGIEAQSGVYTDKAGQKTYVPAMDVDGKLWTMQYIQEDGTKRFAKDSRKHGCFHVVGGFDTLSSAPALVVCEGYATASSLSKSLGFAVVAAFDSGNLPHVAKALHEKFPDKPVVIAGDNDKHLEMTQGINPGRTKANEAATATGGTTLLPIFAPGELIRDPKGFTDFNDLAAKSALGMEGLGRQVRMVVDAVIEKHHVPSIEQPRVEKPVHGQRRAAKLE